MATEVFEELVRTYFQVRGYFTIENVYLSEHGQKRDRTDVDLLCFHPRPAPRERDPYRDGSFGA